MIPYGHISACCTMINVTISGDAFKYKGSKNGVYYMQSRFSNGQRYSYWMSSEGNAIWNWINHTGNEWVIGTTNVALNVPIKDLGKECPHDDLQSHWIYIDGVNWIENVNNSVLVQCVPPS